MAQKTNISWSEFSWNTTTGCNKVSAGCKNCYAETMAKLLKAMGAAFGAMGGSHQLNSLTDKDKHRKPKQNLPKQNFFMPPPNYKFERKGNLRNKPCPCGSIKKFKQCCWDVLGDNNGRK